MNSTPLIFSVKTNSEVDERDTDGQTGRRRGGGDTRQAIAEAARRQFAERGYEAATIRSIATEAGVDPALVMHFYGSKEALFAEVVQWPFDPDEAVAELLVGKRSAVGERLARLFVTTWDAEAGRNPIVALLRTALSQDSAARLFRDFLSTRFFAPLAEGLRIDRPELRTSLASSQLARARNHPLRHALRAAGLDGLRGRDRGPRPGPATPPHGTPARLTGPAGRRARRCCGAGSAPARSVPQHRLT